MGMGSVFHVSRLNDRCQCPPPLEGLASVLSDLGLWAGVFCSCSRVWREEWVGASGQQGACGHPAPPQPHPPPACGPTHIQQLKTRRGPGCRWRCDLGGVPQRLQAPCHISSTGRPLGARAVNPGSQSDPLEPSSESPPGLGRHEDSRGTRGLREALPESRRGEERR